jgi:hypothetical protein
MRDATRPTYSTAIAIAYKPGKIILSPISLKLSTSTEILSSRQRGEAFDFNRDSFFASTRRSFRRQPRFLLRVNAEKLSTSTEILSSRQRGEAFAFNRDSFFASTWSSISAEGSEA